MAYKANQAKPQMVFDKDAYSELEKELDAIEAQFKVREIEITFNKEALFFGDIKASVDVYSFLKNRILKGIEVQEHFIAIFLSQANKIIGYYHHSTGTINATMVDIELLTAVAVKTLAKAVIISHNHPSGNLTPSEADRSLTRNVVKALKYFDIMLIDHIIVTKHGYYSFNEKRESSIVGYVPTLSPQELRLREEILTQLKRVTEANAPNLFEMMQSPQGYEQVEQMVIDKVLHDQMVPAAVIPMLETELTMI
jgi:DNA repair protein RadC